MMEVINGINPYGNIQRIGVGSDNRVVYRVIDSNGQEAGKMTVAQQDVDTFEKSYVDLMSTAPKIQEYVSKHSSPEEINRRKLMSRIVVATGAITGAVIPPLLMKKSSTTKKILTSIGGIVLGLTAGFAGSLAITTPPGTLKFAKATRNLSKIDIQPLNTANIKQLNATRV